MLNIGNKGSDRVCTGLGGGVGGTVRVDIVGASSSLELVLLSKSFLPGGIPYCLTCVSSESLRLSSLSSSRIGRKVSLICTYIQNFTNVHHIILKERMIIILPFVFVHSFYAGFFEMLQIT